MVFAYNENKVRGQSYGFELDVPMKLNVTQELVQKEAAITYSEKVFLATGGAVS